jgi:hypothetical protein
MRKRWLKAPSPALVISLIALFVALGGTGYAAGKSMFSTPSNAAIAKVVKSLAPTLSVKSAADMTTLPSGKSESGLFAGASYTAGSWLGLTIVYPRPLAAAIADTKIIDVQGANAPHCAGAGHAAPGYLCLYNDDSYGVAGDTQFQSDDNTFFPKDLGKLGVELYWVTSANNAYVGGSWTVTAP